MNPNTSNPYKLGRETGILLKNDTEARRALTRGSYIVQKGNTRIVYHIDPEDPAKILRHKVTIKNGVITEVLPAHSNGNLQQVLDNTRTSPKYIVLN